MTNQALTDAFSVRLPPYLRERLIELAAREGRSVGDLIRRTLEAQMQESGTMVLTVTIEAPNWTDAVVGRALHYRINKFSDALRLVASSLQSGGGAVDSTFDHGDIWGHYTLRTSDVPDPSPR